MSEINRWEKAKARVTRAKKEMARVEGALDMTIKEAKTKFGVKTLEEAKASYKREQKKLEKMKAALGEKLDAFDKKWEEVFGD